jgi:hypothetical protein
MGTHHGTVATALIAGAVVAGLLVGCADIPRGWSKSGGSPKEFAEVQQACLDTGASAPDAFEACMRTKGWERTVLRGYYGIR